MKLFFDDFKFVLGYRFCSPHFILLCLNAHFNTFLIEDDLVTVRRISPVRTILVTTFLDYLI